MLPMRSSATIDNTDNLFNLFSTFGHDGFFSFCLLK